MPSKRSRLLHRCAVALTAGAILACAPSLEPERPDVILVIVDTWRFDALGANGSTPSGLTPALDSLATSGVRFERAIATSPWTLPAVASLVTGQYPTVHGAFGRYREVSKIRDNVPTMAEKLALLGYESHAVINAPFLDPRFGFDRGFRTYDYFPSSNLDVRRAAASVDRALALMREIPPERPAFLLLHLFDAHLAYDPPPPWDARWSGEYAGELRAPFTDLKSMREGTLRPDVADAAFIRALYDGEVSYVDQQLGRFVRGLREIERFRERWIIVTADHGEEFQDHGGWEHGHTMYTEQVRVPLVIVPPEGTAPAGATVAAQVRTLDLFPTVLELAHLPTPKGISGRSLLPLLERSSSEHRPALSEREHLGTPARSLRDGDFTLIDYGGSGRSELYEFSSDPLELRDLAEDRPERVRSMETKLEAMMDLLEARSDSTGGRPKAINLDPKLLDQLRSLGYAGG